MVALGLVASLFLSFPNAANAQSSAAPAVQWTEADLVAILDEGVSPRTAEACDYVLIHPDAVNPFFWGTCMRVMWERGDHEQSAFWFYVFQNRARPWITVRNETTDSMDDLESDYRQVINNWVGCDIASWHEIGRRALSYEKKIPLYAGHPKSVSQAEWLKTVGKLRDQYAESFVSAFATLDEKTFYQNRRDQGLYVGPLMLRGAPLPDSWR
jgi:hypothetical protein